jgi:hypothetical protein
MAMADDLIYDVGLHDGGDTGHYLRCGFRVLAIDANPVMMELAKKNYSEALLSGRLTLLNKAIFDKAENRTLRSLILRSPSRRIYDPLGGCARKLIRLFLLRSYRPKLVTAGIGKAAYRGGA